eukprot:4432441-Prymnesium_polylepis.2
MARVRDAPTTKGCHAAEDITHQHWTAVPRPVSHAAQPCAYGDGFALTRCRRRRSRHSWRPRRLRPRWRRTPEGRSVLSLVLSGVQTLDSCVEVNMLRETDGTCGTTATYTHAWIQVRAALRPRGIVHRRAPRV